MKISFATFTFAAVALFAQIALAQIAAANGETVAGFEFGISPETVFERAKNGGLETEDEGKEKDARRETVFLGAMPGVPQTGGETRTRVSFFKGKVDGVTLLVDGANGDDARVFERFVERAYGAPDAEKTVFSYTVKSWDGDGSKVVLSYSNGGVLKLAHTHTGLRKQRREREIKRDRRKDKRHPVQKMIDGDYSKPDYLK